MQVFLISLLGLLLGWPSFVYSEIVQTNYARSIKSVNKGSIVPEGAELEEVVADRVKCEVTPRGSFSCTIPVDAPGGRQGVSPNLAFTYDSQVDNGLLGVGWHLSGYSALIRCDGGKGIQYGGQEFNNLTPAQRANPNASGSYTSLGIRRLEDSICFAQAGIDSPPSLKYELIPQGSSNTVYRTRTETFTQFHKVGTCGDNACYFMVKDSKGNTLYLGGRPGLVPVLNAAASADESQNVPPVLWDLPNRGDRPAAGTSSTRGVHAWLISMIVDIHGNSMTFDYHRRDSGGLYPAQISYTAHQATNTPANYQIQFVYDHRSRPELFEDTFLQISPDCNDVISTPNLLERRLAQVQVRANSIIRKYHLAYQCSTQSGKSLLASIQEEGSDGQRLLPHTFTYQQDNQPAFSSQSMQVRPTNVAQFGITLPTFAEYQVAAEDVGPTYGNHLVGDVNGDGRDDLVVIHNKRLTHYYVQEELDCERRAQLEMRCEIGQGCSTPPPSTGCLGQNGRLRATRHTVGLGNAGYYYLGTDSGLSEATEIFQGDPGDGPEYQYLGDINGDGVKDLIIAHLDPVGDATLYYALGGQRGLGALVTGPRFNAGGVQTQTRSSPNNTSVLSDDNLQFRDLNWLATSGDFNGDGLTDIAYAKDAEIYAALSNGTGFAPFVRYASGGIFGSQTFEGQSVALIGADVNGDGYEDLVNFQQVTHRWRERPKWYAVLFLLGGASVEEARRDASDENGFTKMHIVYALGGPSQASASVSSSRTLFARSGDYELPNLPDEGQRWDFESHLPFEPFVGDTNGDQIADLMLLNRSYWEHYEARRQGSFASGVDYYDSTRPRLGTLLAYRYLGRANMFRRSSGLEEHGVLTQDTYPLAVNQIRQASGPVSAYEAGQPVTLGDGDSHIWANSAFTNTYENHLGDFNCNGQNDLVSAYRGYYGTFVDFSPGDSGGIFNQFIAQIPNNNSPMMDGPIWANHWISGSGDFNGDGCQDLLMAADDPQGSTYIDYFYGTPKGLGEGRSITPFRNTGGVMRKMLKADVDGNGVDDLVMIPALPQEGIKVMMSRVERADLLTQVNNGLGGQTIATYQPASETAGAIDITGVQNQQNRCADGICLGVNNNYRPLTVRVDRNNGRNDNRHVLHEFKNGMTTFAHKSKFTDPGFEKMSVVHGQSRARTDATYYLRPPFEGLARKVENFNGTGQKYAEQETSYAQRTGNGPPEARAESVLVYPTSSISHIFEAGSDIQTVRTAYNNYDDYGNPRDVVEAVGPVASTALVTTSHTDLTHDPVEWFLNRPDGTRISRQGTPIVSWSRNIFQGNNAKERYWKLSRTEEFYCPQFSAGCSEQRGRWIPSSFDYQYDAYGNQTQVRNAQGALTTITYEPGFFQYPKLVSEHHDDNGHGGPGRVSQEFTYDYAGRVKKTWDKYRNITENFYDSFGRLVRTEKSTGGKNEILYLNFGDPNQQLVLERADYHKPSENIQRKVSLKYFDGFGKLYKTLLSGDGPQRQEVVQTETYEPNGNRVITTSDPHYESSAWGGIRIVHDTQNRQIRNERFAAGERPRVVKEYRYGIASGTSRSKVTLRTPGSSANQFFETTYEFNARDLLDKIVDAKGQVTQYSYDGVDNTRLIHLPNNDDIVFTYNSRGQVWTQSEPSKGLTTLTYLDTGELRDAVDALNQTISFTYNNRGQPLTKVLRTAGGQATTQRYFYDLRDLYEMRYPAGWTQIRRDIFGRVLEKRYHVDGLHQPGNVEYATEHFQDFDLQDRPRRMVLPDGSRLDYNYSAAGNLMDLKLNGSLLPLASFTYNAQSQLLTRTAGEVTMSYGYNGDNQIACMASARDALPNNCRSPQGALPSDLDFLRLRYTYDPSLNLNKIFDDRITKTIGTVNTDMTQTFFYDELDRLTYSDGAYGHQYYAYDPIGNLTRKGNYTFTFGNRRLNNYRSPQAPPPVRTNPAAPPPRPQRPVVQLDMTDGTLTHILLAQLNPKGKKITATDAPTGIKIQEKKSDIKSIKQETKPPPPLSTSTTTTTTTTTTTMPPPPPPPPPPPSGALHTSAAYDAVGNLILENEGAEVNLAEPKSNAWRYVYDVENHLTEVWHNNIKIMEMAYDYKGQRIKKIYHPENATPETTTYYLGNNHEVRKIGGVTSTTTHFLGPTGILASKTTGAHPDKPTDATITAQSNKQRSESGNADPSGPPSGTIYYLQDHLGSNAVVFKSERGQPTRVSHTYHYPFGEIANTNSTGLNLTNFGFTGQEVDAGKLMYFDARYYHPFYGRFMTPDLITSGGGLNPQGFYRYAYVLNNPIKYHDPSGNEPATPPIMVPGENSGRNAFGGYGPISPAGRAGFTATAIGAGSVAAAEFGGILYTSGAISAAASVIYGEATAFIASNYTFLTRALGFIGEAVAPNAGGQFALTTAGAGAAAAGVAAQEARATSPLLSDVANVVGGGSRGVPAKVIKESLAKVSNIRSVAEQIKGSYGKVVADLVKSFERGDAKTGIGTKFVERTKGLFELRDGPSGVRAYFTKKGGGAYEIVGYSDKTNQDQVIQTLRNSGY